jgi:hypothetical protein
VNDILSSVNTVTIWENCHHSLPSQSQRSRSHYEFFQLLQGRSNNASVPCTNFRSPCGVVGPGDYLTMLVDDDVDDDEER